MISNETRNLLPVYHQMMIGEGAIDKMGTTVFDAKASMLSIRPGTLPHYEVIDDLDNIDDVSGGWILWQDLKGVNHLMKLHHEDGGSWTYFTATATPGKPAVKFIIWKS